MASTLNEKQVDLLRFLDRQSAPVPAAELDGRIIRALRSRDCITEDDGFVKVTEQGRAVLQGGAAPARRRRGRRPAVEKHAGHGRAQAVRRALEKLELALPRDAELAVGNIFAAADDVVDAFRRYARRIERKQP